jgi:uncharacterized protein (TIGR04255 family)
MPTPSQDDKLPDYKRPPVVETVLGVQFDPIANFGNAQLGAFWKSLDPAEWVSVTDQPALPAQFEFFGDGFQFPPFILTQALRTRLQIRNRAGNRLIQIQHGRLHFNWLGEDERDYPRYHAAIRPGFVETLNAFVKFVRDEGIGEFRPNQWEVTYINNIPKGTVWNTPGDWNFFKPLGAVPTIADMAIGESFTGEWSFLIPGQHGRLHVNWRHGTAPAKAPGPDETIWLTLTARGPTSASGDVNQAVLDGIDLGHDTIVKAFRALMSDEANKYWGLEQ